MRSLELHPETGRPGTKLDLARLSLNIKDMHCAFAAGILLRIRAFAWLMLGWFAVAGSSEAAAGPPTPELLTNLSQLRANAGQTPLVVHPFRVIADVIDVDSEDGALLLRDGSGVEFVRVDLGKRDVHPGATVCLEGNGCAVEPDRFGVDIIPGMVVENDGIHALTVASGVTFLHAGRVPITVKWFNWFGVFGLNVEYEGPNLPRQQIPSSVLSRAVVAPATGCTNFAGGLDYRCYEGVWEILPDFEKDHPVRTGTATNFDLNVRTRDTAVGLEFKGFITIPSDGVYTFHAASDDGSRLFVGGGSVDTRVLGQRSAPAAWDGVPASVSERNNAPWVTLEGVVNSASTWNSGGELQMRVGNHDIRVEVFDSDGFASTITAHCPVRVSGIYEDVVTEEGSRVPGRLRVLNWKDVRPIALSEVPAAETVGDGETGRVRAAPARSPISTVAGVKALSFDMARQALPVSIRGVVTAYVSKNAGAVVQDSTRGVYVDLREIPGSEPLQHGELCQIEGVTGPGSFSPVVVARRITHLGPSQLPKPLNATWDQLVNGTLDTEYAEIEGVVTAVHDRQVVLLVQGGKIALNLIDFQPEFLVGCENALVRIRGCLFANFNQETHRLGPGSLSVRNSAIDVVQPAPRNLFDAPRKSIGELLLYDSKAAPLRLLKVSAQIIYGRPGEYYLTDGTNGLHVITRDSDHFAAGGLVDAVGFLELGGPAAELKEAVMRRTGSAPLRPPTKLSSDQLLQAGYADMLVQVDATLMNHWREGLEDVLELQSGFLAFKARINSGRQAINLPPAGSRLELTGAYAPQGNRAEDGTVSGFELLLPSPLDIRVLATPPWWNLRRMLVLAGILGVLLLAVLFWNKELQRKVQVRGRQLEHEIRNRQRAELQRAAEAERARIARDLHDELGTGLTEVSLLADAGLAESHGTGKEPLRFHDIAEKARALVSGLDVIVWAIDPKRNSLQSFADYLGRYATELFSASGIVCRFKIPIECDPVTMTEAARHSLFLAVKEALNNVIRHASATEVELQISQSPDLLQIVVADNGRGFDWNKIQPGDGLANLRARLEALNGQCDIQSQAGKGTTVRFSVPLPGDSTSPPA